MCVKVCTKRDKNKLVDKGNQDEGKSKGEDLETLSRNK